VFKTLLPFLLTNADNINATVETQPGLRWHGKYLIFVNWFLNTPTTPKHNVIQTTTFKIYEKYGTEMCHDTHIFSLFTVLAHIHSILWHNAVWLLWWLPAHQDGISWHYKGFHCTGSFRNCNAQLMLQYSNAGHSQAKLFIKLRLLHTANCYRIFW
jgi:hypothetical protein